VWISDFPVGCHFRTEVPENESQVALEEVLIQLRRDPALDGTYIAMLTADAMGEGATQFRNLGADTFLTKPIDIPLILDLLEEIATREVGLVS